MSQKYFGTDGIRGRVGEAPITAEFMLKLGWAVGRVLGRDSCDSVLIGKDTRISGYMFESALEAGLSAAGMNIRLLGPMPTPAIAYLTRTLHCCAGIVISASHNPYYDNGVKFFSAEGTKLPDAIELEIEAQLDKPMSTVSSDRLGKAERVSDAEGRYIEFCKSTVPMSMSLRGLKVVVDCANGATYQVAPAVFDELGAEVIAIGDEPNGLNINQDCGSTRPEQLIRAVRETGADLGIAFDGDGDRVIMIDHAGTEVDGDELLYIIARSRHETGNLNGGVVGTLMTNLGMEHALQAIGIPLRRARVGDRYVLELLQSQGWVVGGESSGHIICLDRTSTGDGIVSALQVLYEMVRSGRPLAELRGDLTKYPQHMINVPIAHKADPDHSEAVQTAVRAAEARLAERGRVLLRPSGTEPVIRVMVEGEDPELVAREAQALAEVVAGALGKARAG
ncbi:phosphoglucosamine mutase [Thiohalobacter thiocyanaticus]|uniref:Phosphoglucosamine mutase n=1 Tax=Thiohalobacter thiocyanaticus TaxID=585455 RepID=A0A426QG53_9GAMM|nr:phosphoglucosamine mutase [Thiohalobacter thiocyanaticus]RRQ20724.1 phosphoglucosamine mutase [Thiohalobacter thiocyanaticus]